MKTYIVAAVLLLLSGVSASNLRAQDPGTFAVVEDKDKLETIVPASFFFAGLSGPTQRRNSAAGTLGDKRHVVAGLVDVSGYSTDISGIYEGFFITDSDIRIGGKPLPVGAYGIGFAKDQGMNIFDLSGKKILTVSTTRDDEMRRPRPLMMTVEKDGIRLYKGRDYVLIRP